MKLRRRALSKAILIAVFVGGILSAVGRAEGLAAYQLSDGSRWLVGCVPTETAARMWATEQFAPSGPVGILCIEGYSPVHKQVQ
jgi:hypothetical protein